MTEPKTLPLDACPVPDTIPDIQILEVSLNTPERFITAVVPQQSQAAVDASINRARLLTIMDRERPQYICAPEGSQTREDQALAKLRSDRSVPNGLIRRCREILGAYNKDPEADFNQPHLIEAQIQEMEKEYIKPIHKEIETSAWLLEHAKLGKARASEKNENIPPFFTHILNKEPDILEHIEALRFQVQQMEVELTTLRERTAPSTGSSNSLVPATGCSTIPSKESASAD